MTTEEIQKVLELHKKWLKGDPDGVRANLEGANLFGANLGDANLGDANLGNANLGDAYLEGAYLEGANLKGANLVLSNLRDANLEGANLEGANLYGAYLYGANLEGVYLYGANLLLSYLKGANLVLSNLRDANLKGANLEGANLEGAHLEDANLKGAKLPDFQICPQEESFIAYKKTTKGVIKVLIPEDAKRTNSLIGRKCRTSKLVVLGGEGVGGTGPNYAGIIYNEGETIECLDYDGDIRVECTKGIHFFMTEQEARDW